MARSSLDLAKSLLRRRKFSLAITYLESRSDIYENDFEYLVTLGIACLYVGDVGNAMGYFGRARRIRINDVNLLLGQAAVFLRRGDTRTAMEYYLDVQELDPQNRIVREAKDFIRKNTDVSSAVRGMIDTGSIEKFYPPLGINPDVVRNCILGGIFLGIVVSVFVLAFYPRSRHTGSDRMDISMLQLTSAEKKDPVLSDMSGIVVNYLMNSRQIVECYDLAVRLFSEHRDNAARVEINRLLGSNASSLVKHKASLLASYLEEPTFDTLVDNYDFLTVSSDPALYKDVYVAWSGRIANATELSDGSWACDLLVGYEDKKTVTGRVKVMFPSVPAPSVDGSRPVRFLGKIDVSEDEAVLSGRAIYQPLKGSALK